MTKIAIFDLDGTLLNTIADIAAATNHALSLYGYPTHECNAYRFFVGSGINMLFFRALPEEARTEKVIAKIRVAFKEYYKVHGEDQTRPYDGICELLAELQEKGVALAVASNKYHEATTALVRKFFPEFEFAAVLGQREGVPVKPDPQVIYDILEQTGFSKEEVLYIGDSDVDMLTANAASVKGVGVGWGFRTKEELMSHNPYAFIEDPKGLLALI